MAKKNRLKDLSFGQRIYLTEIVKGLGLTLKNECGNLQRYNQSRRKV